MHPSSTAPCHGDPLIQSFIWNATVTLGTRQRIGAIQRFINGSGDVLECGLQVPQLGEDLRRREAREDASWEESRVGKECVCKCRLQWAPYHQQQKEAQQKDSSKSIK